MPIVPIASLDDPRLADFSRRTDVALRHDQQSEHGIFLTESALVTSRALDSGYVPRAVLALDGSRAEAERLLADYPDVPVFTGSDELLSGHTGYQLHRGLIGSFDRPARQDPAELLAGPGRRTVVILENIADPTNVGAIFRSVAGIGADAVLVTERCSDPFYRRAIRVSMGSTLLVPWTRTAGWAETRAALDAAGFHLATFDLTDGAVPLRQFAANRPEKLAIVLGEEGPGITAEATAAADTVVTIPMRHGVDSLNVAAASAVAIWALAGG
ncbi:RNA methyltransferase [Leucobacter sp. CX87]|uniref:TrmH family RNA methyltransferase n=1 Tax=unclassified Leucobacter TaxID=2621730 RepID=UPI00333EAC9A